MALVSNILAATELAIGRNPNLSWIDTPVEMLYPPGTGTDGVNIGVSVAKAVSVYVLASPRHYVGRKSAYLTISRQHFLSSYTYTATVDGTSYTTTGQATAMAAVADLVDQINTAAVGNIRAAAVPRFTDGVLDTLWVYETDVNNPAATADMTVDWTSDGPAEATEGYVDPESFKIRLWVRMKSPAEFPVQAPWVVPQHGDLGAVPAQGFVERFNAAGLERLYVETYDVVKATGDGAGVQARPFVVIAPAVPEE